MVVRLCCRSKRRERLVQQHSITSWKTLNFRRTGEMVRTFDSLVTLSLAVQHGGMFGCLVGAVGLYTAVIRSGKTADWCGGRREVVSKNKLRPSALLSLDLVQPVGILLSQQIHTHCTRHTDRHALYKTDQQTRTLYKTHL
jgi:hypothetical protein